jgi:hypothetical protein
MTEERREAYRQEWRNFRRQARLPWARLQAILLIEGACLAALYVLDLDAMRCLVAALFASLLVLILSLLALKDQRNAAAHLERVLALEKEFDPPLPPFARPRPVLGMKAATLLAAALLLVNVWNALVIVDQVYYLVGDSIESSDGYV